MYFVTYYHNDKKQWEKDGVHYYFHYKHAKLFAERMTKENFTCMIYKGDKLSEDYKEEK